MDIVRRVQYGSKKKDGSTFDSEAIGIQHADRHLAMTTSGRLVRSPQPQEEIDSINNRFESLRELIAQAIKDSMQLNKNRMQKEAEANVKVMQEKIKNLEPLAYRPSKLTLIFQTSL